MDKLLNKIDILNNELAELKKQRKNNYIFT